MSNPEMTPEWEQPVQKSSSSSKWLIGLGIGCGGLFLLCCGGLIIGGMMVAKNFQVTQDRDEILAMSNELAEIDVPEPLSPAAGLDWSIPFVGQRMFVAAVYADQSTDSMLMLMQVGEAFRGGENEAQFRQQIDQSLRQQGVSQNKQAIQFEEQEERELTINGQPATFQFAKGKNVETGQPVIQVTGTFDGKNGPVMLMFLGDAETFDEETILGMLESIGAGEGPPEQPADAVQEAAP